MLRNLSSVYQSQQCLPKSAVSTNLSSVYHSQQCLPIWHSVVAQQIHCNRFPTGARQRVPQVPCDTCVCICRTHCSSVYQSQHCLPIWHSMVAQQTHSTDAPQRVQQVLSQSCICAFAGHVAASPSEASPPSSQQQHRMGGRGPRPGGAIKDGARALAQGQTPDGSVLHHFCLLRVPFLQVLASWYGLTGLCRLLEAATKL